ncbi:SusC/RagA family TonB-linked outer membrane protein [Bacteroidales bacterium]|nr:SusC/RagA family TonB-linked outer membrane protein [Bacteroidales bacterium]
MKISSNNKYFVVLRKMTNKISNKKGMIILSLLAVSFQLGAVSSGGMLDEGLDKKSKTKLYTKKEMIAQAQQGEARKKITGRIVDSDDEVVIGASIVVKGTSNGTVSDLEGVFELNVPNNGTIVISYIGYETQELSLEGKKFFNVVLSEDAKALAEVTIVAFGKQKKESVIGSITTVKPAELKIPSSNLTTALAGRMSGLISYQRSGEPGADNAQFFIRGVTTFGYKKDPLILIDNNESSTQELSRLQPDDIASFSIMKDATATSLYGSRGANGVILVSTKQGTEGKVKISIRLEEAISRPTRMVELADPITYMRLHNEAIRTRNPLGVIPYSQHKIDNTIAGTNPYVYPANDWHKIMFKDHANNHRLNFNIAGGGKVANYYLAGSVINDNGVLNVDKQSNFNSNVNLTRYMLRANINIKATKTTEIIVRMSGSFDDYSGPIDGGSDLFRRVMKTNPVLFPPYYKADKANETTQHLLFGNHGAGGQYINPYAEMTRGYKDYTTSQMSIQFELKQDLDFILKGLSMRGMFNTNRYAYFDVARYYNPFYYEVSTYDKANDEYTLAPLNETSGTDYLDYSEGPKNINSTTYFEGGMNWLDSFGDVHEVSALTVFTLREGINANAGDLQRSLPYRNVGLAGRATYAYDSRYLTEVNFGYNGSERFSKKERFGFFPSAGVGWIISNEGFWGDELKKTVSNLKLKATYGLVGNDAIGDANDRFFYLSNVDMNDSNAGSSFGTYGNSGGRFVPGITIGRYANENITWETAKKFNFTTEIGLWNKLDIQVELYKENRTNILMNRATISSTMGLQAPVRANVGEASSKGVDISLTGNHSINADTWISAMANFTYATSKFTVYEEPDYSNEPWKSRVGYSLNQEWGYIAERLFVDEEEVRNSPKQFGEYMAGDIKYKDLNGDGKINDLDKAPIGYPTSPEIVYGFGFSGGWKSLDVSCFFQGSARSSFWLGTHDDWNGGAVDTSPFLDNSSALLQSYADSHWSENNRDLYAIWPRLSATRSQNNTERSTWFMRDGSFIRLKSVEVGYTIPPKIATKAKMAGLRCYFSGTNLLTFSKFKMWDPEMGGNGLGYPIQKVFNFGVQLSF